MLLATTSSASRLAIHGGKPVIEPGTIEKWPPIDEADEQMVLASLHGGNHSFGLNCLEFQAEFARWNGNGYALTTNSGTAALHMCLAACECGIGDEVIVPAYSWSSSATCVLHHDCIPVFVDIDWQTINIDVSKIEAAISEKTKAIIVVHLHGLPVEMDGVIALAKKYNLKVIEDACQAHGATYRGQKVGTLGDCGAFSFNQMKCLCSGEGGMFVTNDRGMWGRAAQLWSFGENRAPSEARDYHAYALGWMYRNNDLTAAFGRSQLRKLNHSLEIQRSNVEVLHRHLVEVPGLVLPHVPPYCEHNWYNYVVRFDMEALAWEGPSRALRDRIHEAMVAEGLGLSVWQSCILPAMTVFRAKNAYGKGHPWSSPHARPVDYRADAYPVAQRHCDTHTCVVLPLRAPNGVKVAKLLARGIEKVMDQVELLKDEVRGGSSSHEDWRSHT